MADDDTLDAFLAPADTKKKENKEDNKPKEDDDVTISLEDEFAKLLNDFINQDKPSVPLAPQPAKTDDNSSLDSFITSSPTKSAEPKKEEQGLDSFISAPTSSPQVSQGSVNSLDGMITQNTTSPAPAAENTENAPSTAKLNQELKSEEQELARAISNFQEGIIALAEKKNLKVPKTDYTEEMLNPNYKPSVGKKIAQYLLASWDIINKSDPENMKRLSKDANDEEYLTFAESLSDTDMQLSIISYVEILINLEICEVKYEQKKEIVKKNRIKKELYEEYIKLQERKNLFIKKLKEKNFPIDVDKLIGNYFRVAQKDPEGSFDALVKNPAMFAPIEMDKISPKFFGLIKVAPEDGVKANNKIGNFIKKLKI